MFPVCLAGAEVDAENFDSLAALTANARRQPSVDETMSSILALTTFPEGST